MEKPKKLDLYVDGLLAKYQNNLLINSTINKLDNDQYIEEFITNEKLFTNEEFIDILAIKRRAGYGKASGGGNNAAEEQIARLYENNQWKFVEEFLQNADDCNYNEEAFIQIIIDEKDNSIEFIYNEVGFSRRDIWGITAFSQSTKTENADYTEDEISDYYNEIAKLFENHAPEEGAFYYERTGRKGIGFKAVFSLKAENVLIRIDSNGYSFTLDNQIGTAVPVWNIDKQINDGLTHVKVQFVNSELSIDDIYDKFEKIFCINDSENLFSSCPALFMHKIKHVIVKCKSFQRNYGFEIKLSDNGEPVFDKEINVDDPVLSAIYHDGKYYQKMMQNISITRKSDDKESVVTEAVKLTINEKVEGIFRNFSIIAPVLNHSSDESYIRGSLFRTFPMADNQYNIPLAIDAPFDLNQSRSGLQYSEKSKYNQIVADIVFKKDGIFESVMYKLRDDFDLTISSFIPKEKIELFNDANDKNKELVKVVNLTSLLKSYPLFKKYFNENEYVSYNEAIQLDKEMYRWPKFDSLISSFNDIPVDNLIAEKYSEIDIQKIKLYGYSEFSDKVNTYLDLLEASLSFSDFSRFLNDKLIPYIVSIVDDISNDSLQALKIFIFDVKQNGDIIKCRESYSDKQKYLFTNEKKYVSVNKYRIILDDTSYATLISSMKYNIAEDFETYFHDYSTNENIKTGESWRDIADFIEASLEYGFDISQGKINYNKIVFSVNIDPEFNLFRESGTCDIIPDEDIESLSRYYNNDKDEVVRLIKNTGMAAKELYSKANGILKFSPATVGALKKIDEELVDSACELLKNSFLDKEEHSINIGFDECKLFHKKILLCIFRNEYYFSRDNLKSISRSFLNMPSFLNEKYPELIIRALVLSEYNEYVNVPEDYCLSISIREIIENNFVDCIRHIINDMKSDFIEIFNDGYFDEIDNTEIWPLLEKAGCNRKTPEEIKFYKNKSIIIPDDNGNRPFLVDGREANVYLNVDDSGDFKRSLSKYLNRKFDSDYLKYYNRMARNFEKVKEEIISPVLAENMDLDSTYKKIRKNYSVYSKKDIISIISWFSNQGYADVVSGGKSNEKEIDEDYVEEPWKFVYEFFQNVDDCSFSGTDLRNLRITINKELHSISFEYNEDGFTLEDIEAITRFNQSNKNKEDNKYKLEHNIDRDGVIILNETGRKGRGFKSVFALPDEDMKVRITSNGYNFEFFKKLGYSIPVWFDEDYDNKKSGTVVRIDALSDETIDNIAENLRRLFYFNEFENVFSSCPSLFLRNLEKISVIDSDNEYSVELTPRDDGEYSECIESPFLDNVNGVIRRGGKYYKNLIEKYSLVIRNSSNEEDVVIPIIKCSMMVDYNKENDFQKETNVISVIAPVIEIESSRRYVRGCLFQTLPLEKEVFDLPIAINAEFETDSGRSHVNIHKYKSKVLLNEIIPDLLIKLYYYLREIQNINIVPYLNRSVCLFENDEEYKIKIGEIINEFDVLKLYSGEGFVSANQAVIMHDCTEWPGYDYLYQCFNNAGNNALIDPKYIKQKINVKNDVRLFSASGFVERLNQYLDYIENLTDENIVSVLNDYVYPYLAKNFTSIEDQYYRLGKNILGNLSIFIFEDNKGNLFRESMNEKTCWISNTPSGKKSCGIFRTVEHIPCDWKEKNSWISSMISDCEKRILDFSNAFKKDNLDFYIDDTWETTKQIIVSLMYYEANTTGNKITLDYLKKCIFDEDIEFSGNVYLKAFDDLNKKNILKHKITEKDIEEICIGSGLDLTCKSKIITGISSLGILKCNDFFEIDNKSRSLRLNDQIGSVLSCYCTTMERADEIITAISLASDNDPNRSVFEILYSDIKDCTPYVMLSVLNKFDKLRHKEDLAAEYYNDNNNSKYTIEQKSAILLCSKYMKPEEFKCERRISFDYSEVIKESLGVYLRDYNLNKNLIVDIRMNSEFIVYEGNAVNEALSWMNDKEAKSDTTHFSFYKTDLSQAFDRKYKKNKYIFDSTKVILDTKNTEGALLDFTKNVLNSADDAILKNLIDISVNRAKLTNWNDDTGSKKEFVSELSKYRKYNDKTISILFNSKILKVINDASSNPTEYIIAELLQNINDCLPNSDDEKRILSVELDDLNGIMKLKYNESGFSYANVYSITGVGQSTKHDKSEGEKGLGFKKVFKVFDRVNVLSNEFYFTLSADKDELTTIKWDEQYQSEYEKGYTTMIFFIRNGDEFRNEFEKLVLMWKRFFEGKFLDSTISPLFLENIAEYHSNISTDIIKREDFLKGYYYHKISIMNCFKGMLDTTPNKYAIIEDAYAKLMTRGKCEYMTEVEKKEYIDGLEIAVCIPKKPDESKCYFYSTLKTEEPTHISLNINIPFELSTARDAIMRNEYNQKLNEIIFNPINGMKSMFGRLLEEVIREDKEPIKNFWTCISGDIKAFISFFDDKNEEKRIDDIKKWNIFDPYKRNNYVSLSEGYSVEEIIYKYLHEVDESEIRFDFVDWIKTKKCKRIESRILLDISSGNYLRFDKLSSALGLKTEEIYPLIGKPRSVALLYFKDEYEK